MGPSPAAIFGLLVVICGASAESCPAFFGGSGCTEIQCLNGGHRVADKNICVCPPGYLGIHCEAVKTSLPPYNHFKAGGTSFNILNINLFTQYWGVKTYSNIRTAIQNHFDAFPNGYDNYNLLETNSKPYLDSIDMPIYDIQFADLSQSKTSFSLSDATDTGLYWCYSVPFYAKLTQMIRDASLKNTVVTIVTQHPPSNDDSFDEARETAVAFGVRVNVLWISDVTFNRCRDAQCVADIDAFKTFVDITGGLFVQLQAEQDDVPTQRLVSQVLLTHYRPQYVSIQSFADCTGGKAVPLVVDPLVKDPYNFVFLGNNANPSVASFRDCNLGQPLRSFDGQLAIFQSVDPTCGSFTVSANGSCTAIVFTSAAVDGPLDVTVFTTYVEDPTVDASRYAIVETVPLYPAFHVEAADGAHVTVNAVSGSFATAWSSALKPRSLAAFEWTTADPITCDASQTDSLFLNITVDGNTVQRAVRVACVPIPTVTTVAPTTTSEVTTSTIAAATSSEALSTSTAPSEEVSTSSSEPSTTSSSPERVCTVTANPATFLFAYATELNLETFALTKRTIVAAVSADQHNYTTLGNVRFDTKTGEPIVYSYNALDYSNECEKNQPNATLAAEQNKESDVLDTIRSFLKTSENPANRTLESSVLVVLVNRLPKSGNDLTDDEYDQLTNSNVKIFLAISHTSLIEQKALIGRSGDVFNRLAAQTNGHYVVASNTIGQDANSDLNKIVGNFMQTAYLQNLLFTRNIGHARVGTNIGTVRVPSSASGKVTVTVTASLSAVDVHVPQPPNSLLLAFKPNGNETKTVSINFLSLDSNYANANFYITTIELEAGYDRELFLHYVAGSDQSDLLIRMWIANNAYHHAGYAGLGGSDELAEVDEYTGAALRLKIFNDCYDDKTGTLLITDCNGEVSAKYDADQIVPLNSTHDAVYPFVPFFCDSRPSNPTCVDGADSKYDAQFVAADFSVTRSFQCRPGVGAISENCQLTDANGNHQCSGAAPFKRGPTGQLPDCSNHGRVRFDQSANVYVCQCDAGYFGESCEQVTCKDENVDPLAVDNQYHTYTVVLEISEGLRLVLADAKSKFGLINAASKFENIWKYQLLTYCTDGSVEMIYSGGDLAAFQSSFNYNKAGCNGVATEAGAIDLTAVYKEAVRGIGRNEKGVIVYYSEKSNLLNVTLDEFVSASQAYQQQLFVYVLDELDNSSEAVPVNESLAQAAMTTGGFLIQSWIDPLENVRIDETFIPSLLASSSSIAWYSSSQTTDFSYSTSNSSVVTYFISWKAGDSLKTSNSELFSACELFDNLMASCKVTGQDEYTVKRGSGGGYYVAVYVLDDVAPRAIIISDLGQDAANAVSTSTSDTRTILSIRVPSDYTVVGNDNDYGVTRNAQRTGCTFNWTAYSVFSSEKYTVGANFAKITLKKEAKTYTRFFSFGTSTAALCKNGGTPVAATGSCACPSGFRGADCSLVVCQSAGSTPNAWSDVCVCDAIDDVSCASRYSPKSLLFF